MDIYYFSRLAIIILYLFLPLGMEASRRRATCLNSTCQADGNAPLSCSSGSILISDVTSKQRGHEPMILENVKRVCMGSRSCDSNRVCGQPEGQALSIHYVCVEDSEILPQSTGNSCSHAVSVVSGYIQSPGYPSRLRHHKECRWRLRLGKDFLVVITLHDVHTNGSGVCDGGLMVSGHACDGEGHAYAPRLLCGGDAQSSFIRCGQVDIGLSESAVVYPLRFWLSFHVQPRHKPPSLSGPRCPSWHNGYNTIKSQEDTGSSQTPGTSTTMLTPNHGGHSDTELLIILLSIISGISVVLFIILVVVCIRCHLLQSPSSDQVYSIPSSGLQAHIDYISTLDAADKLRPQLADGYFEVADALPVGLRIDNVASPAYAEVEQFAPLHKGEWHTYSEPDNFPPTKGAVVGAEKGSKATLKETSSKDSCGGDERKTEKKKSENHRKSNEYSLEKFSDTLDGEMNGNKKSRKRGLDRFRGDKSVKSATNVDLKPVKQSFLSSQSKSKTTNVPVQGKNATDSDNSLYEDCTSSGYEPIDFPPSKHSTPPKLTKKNTSDCKSSAATTPNKQISSNTETEKKTMGLKPPTFKSERTRRKPRAHEDRGPHLPRVKVVSETKENLISFKDRKYRTPSRSSPRHPRAQLTAKKEVPQTQGIVKNGIKLFERNDAVA